MGQSPDEGEVSGGYHEAEPEDPEALVESTRERRSAATAHTSTARPIVDKASFQVTLLQHNEKMIIIIIMSKKTTI